MEEELGSETALHEAREAVRTRIRECERDVGETLPHLQVPLYSLCLLMPGTSDRVLQVRETTPIDLHFNAGHGPVSSFRTEQGSVALLRRGLEQFHEQAADHRLPSCSQERQAKLEPIVEKNRKHLCKLEGILSKVPQTGLCERLDESNTPIAVQTQHPFTPFWHLFQAPPCDQ